MKEYPSYFGPPEKTQDEAASSYENNIGEICLRVKLRGNEDICMMADHRVRDTSGHQNKQGT